MWRVTIDGYVVGEYPDRESAKHCYDEVCYENLHGDNWKSGIKINLENMDEIAKRRNRNKQNAKRGGGVYRNATLRLLQQTEDYRRRKVSQDKIQQGLDVLGLSRSKGAR